MKECRTCNHIIDSGDKIELAYDVVNTYGT